MNSKIFDDTCVERDKLYASLGKVDADVIAHLINPAFMGGPSWPALRQAFSVIRLEESTIVVSNGLSDPFDGTEEPNSGFSVEIMAEAPEKLTGDISKTWLFQLVYAVSQQAAHSGQFKEYLDRYGVITMELYASDCGLESIQNESGMVGVMLGVEHPERPKTVLFPGGEIALVTVKILTSEELEYVALHRAEGRTKLHNLFKESGSFHFCEVNRKSLI